MTNKKTLFIGPAKTSWWKYKLAGIVWKLTRENPISYVAYIPGVKRAALWSFKVRVMSRDIELVEDS